MVVLVVSFQAVGVLDVQSQPFSYGIWTWSWVLGAGFFAAVSFLLISEAFRRAEAGLLAPFQYLEILGATAAGYPVIGNFPDTLTWVGIAIILASGLYVAHREQVKDVEVPHRRTAR